MEIRGVHVVKKRLADGTVRKHFYHRASKTKIHAPYGTASFREELAAAEKAWLETPSRDRARGTLKEQIAIYKASRAFTKLAARTQADYTKQIAVIEERFGLTPIEVFNDRLIRGDIIDWRDELARRSLKQADYAVTVLGVIISDAYDRGKLTANHVAGIERVYEADRADKLWLPEHIAAFNKHARPVLQNALMLALHTGQRQGDLLKLSWGSYDGGAVRLRQGKTGATVEIPCTAALRQMLNRLSATKSATVILTNADGAGWKSDAFRLAWGRAFTKAKKELPSLEGLTFNDLRGTAVTMLAEAGATVPQIAAITGHTLKSAETILETYLSRTKGLALAGIRKLEANARRTKSVNRRVNRSKSGG